MEGYYIRESKEIDIDQIYEIELEAFSVPWTKKSILSEITNQISYYLVMMIDKEVIGYIGIWKILDEGHITNLAIKKKYRRYGFGHKLIEEAMCRLTRLGVRSYTLEVRISNKKAIDLYLDLGFEIAGIRKKFYNEPIEDGLIMWRLE